MDKEEHCSFTEKINGITFVVNVKSADGANVDAEKYIKALITDEILLSEPDVT